MTRSLFILLLLTLVICSAAYAAPITDASNPHNLSSGSAAGSVRAQLPSAGGTDQICVFCHTPHSAAPESPLWNRPDPTGPNGDGTFPVYAQPLGIKTDPALTGYNSANLNYPSGASRMCLSCHDGVTSVGVLLGNQTIAMEGGLTNLTTGVINLATSHPISFNYNQDVVDYIDPADLNYQLPVGAIAIDTPLDGAGQMQCTTCHDPHEDTKGLATYGNLPFWRHQAGLLLSYSEVCDACHKTNPSSSSPPHALP